MYEDERPHPETLTPMRLADRENHLIDRIGWLRAAVLGGNGGLVSSPRGSKAPDPSTNPPEIYPIDL